MDNNQNNQKRGSAKTWLFSIFTILILLAGIMWWMPHVALGLIYTDAETVNDAELTLESIDIEEADNAYFLLNDIGVEHTDILSEYGEEISDYASGDEWNKERAQEILDTTGAVQQKFTEAAMREAFQDPLFRNSSALQEYMKSQFPQDYDDSDIMNLSSVRAAARLQQIKSRMLLGEGRYEDSLDAALTNIRIGEMMLNSQSELIYNLTGLSIHQKGLDSIDGILENMDDDRPGNLIHVAETLGAMSISGLQNTYKLLYQQNAFGHDALAESGWEAVYGEPLDAEGGVLPADPSQISFYFHPNKTKQIAADYFMTEVEKVKDKCWSEGGNYDRILAYNELPEEEWKHKFIPNYVGKVMITTVPAMSVAIDNACEQQERALNLSAEISVLE